MMDVGGLSLSEALSSLREFSKTATSYELVESSLASIGERLPELDELIAKHTQNWSFDRLAKVDRNLLRLATFELLVGKDPFQVVISEAVDLAKEFSDDKSGAFVNGVLDAVWRTVSATSETPQE